MRVARFEMFPSRSIMTAGLSFLKSVDITKDHPLFSEVEEFVKKLQEKREGLEKKEYSVRYKGWYVSSSEEESIKDFIYSKGIRFSSPVCDRIPEVDPVMVEGDEREEKKAKNYTRDA